jgi:putative endonuclease
MDKQFCVYILASQKNGTLYIGITSELVKRVWQHKNKQVDSFTKKYEVDRLVYYEVHENAESAIQREKQVKKWNRVGNCASSKRQIPHGGICMKISFESLDSRRSLSSNALVGDGNDAWFIAFMALALL